MNSSIYVALDFDNQKHAIQFLEQNELDQVPVKVGMQLFYREGPNLVEQLKERGHPIFLDLKLHDIPNTVYHAMKNIASLNVDIVNVHAAGGKKMIEAAREGLNDGIKTTRPQLIAVTQLTSTNDHMLKNEILIEKSIDQVVQSYSQLAQNGGTDGVVCSVYEVEMIKQVCGDQFLTITPGIRLLGDQSNDQERVATPALARQKMTDYLVIGRSITQANNPKEAYEKAVKEWNNGISKTVN